MKARFSLWGPTIFAAAMAFVETASVVTLKRLYFPEGWAAPFHAIPPEGLLLEQCREIATLVMIAAVAFLGRPKLAEGIARGLWIFGVWLLLYYFFLRVLTGFPARLTDLDVVFLVPRTWIAPVWLPLASASLSLILALKLRPR